jgi:hypothetical protein
MHIHGLIECLTQYFAYYSFILSTDVTGETRAAANSVSESLLSSCSVAYDFIDTAMRMSFIANRIERGSMAYRVNFSTVETTGLESSPVARSLAGLRANEARYFWNKYKFTYIAYPANEKQNEIAWFKKMLKEERELEFSSPILEVTIYEDDDIYWPDFIYENGMILNVLYEKNGAKPKRAVGIKLCEDMEVPEELEGKFKFAHQRSKLAGSIRGSFFTIKQEWL